jgi:hypothetical protein
MRRLLGPMGALAFILAFSSSGPHYDGRYRCARSTRGNTAPAPDPDFLRTIRVATNARLYASYPQIATDMDASR